MKYLRNGRRLWLRLKTSLTHPININDAKSALFLKRTKEKNENKSVMEMKLKKKAILVGFLMSRY